MIKANYALELVPKNWGNVAKPPHFNNSSWRSTISIKQFDNEIKPKFPG